MDKKQQIIAALQAFIGQRPGLEFCDYGDVTSYRAEMRAITKDLHHTRQLLRDVELRDSITAEMIISASKGAYSGRLSIIERADGAIGIDYCAGQYWPTEYRRAVCAVLAAALWDWKRDYCMPEPVVSPDPVYGGKRELYNGMTGGDWLRRSFRNEYGRAIAARWFD